MAEEQEWSEAMDVDAFIEEYAIDGPAAAALRTCPEHVLVNVLSQGAPSGANPSAIVMSRIKQAKDTEAVDMDYDTFIMGVDDQARDALLAQSEEVVRAVMEEGSLTGQNPSAILMARIRKAKKELGMGGGGGGGGGARGGRSKPAAKPKAVAPMPMGEIGAASSGALQGLAVALCKLNASMWDVEVPQTSVTAAFKAALKAREAAHAAAFEYDTTGAWGEEEWAAEEGAEPPKKRTRTAVEAAGGQELTDVDKEERREEILQEVVRMVKEAGGRMNLQDIGNKQLTEMRKGVVGNLAKFLATRPDVVTLSFLNGTKIPSVTLVKRGKF